MNAIAYTRVSTDKQADSGAGLAAQTAAIAAYAAKAGLTITAAFSDAAVSGSKGVEDRAGLTAAIASLRKGDLLIVAKRDRLGRDQFVVLGIERAVAKRGCTIAAADGLGNGEGAADVFMRQILDAAAEFERGLIRTRTKAAMQAKRVAGQIIGEVPFGYVVDAAGILHEDAGEQLVIQKIIACREAGLSYRAIAKILSDAAIVPKSGLFGVTSRRPLPWSHTSIVSILKRQASISM